MNRTYTFLLAFALAVFGPVASAMACATCRPNPMDPITKAADMSVLFLGGLVMGIIGLIISFFCYLYYRSRHPLLDPAQLIVEAVGVEESDEPEGLPGRA